MNKKIVFVAALSLASLLSSCGEPLPSTSENSNETPSSVDVSKIATELKLGVSSPLTLKVGESKAIEASVLPASASQEVSYEMNATGILDAAELSKGVLKALAAGSATVTVKTVAKNAEGQPLSKAVEVTVEEASSSTIAPIVEAGTYTVEGVVAAKTAKGFIVDDGEAAVYVYKTTKLEIGAGVTVSGEVTNHFGLLEFSAKARLDAKEVGEVSLPDATPLTEEIISEYKAYGTGNPLPCSKIRPMSFTATCVKDGTFTNFYLEEGGTKISPLALDTSNSELTNMQEGVTYTVTGYPTTYNTKNNYFAFVFESAVAQA